MNTDQQSPRHKAALGRTVNRKAFQRGRQNGDIKLAYNWDKHSMLGEGAFGKVYRAKSLHDSKREVAVKQVMKSSCEDLDELWKEIGILEEIDHPHTLRFLEAYEDYRHVYIVTELCQGGDLLKFLGQIRGDLQFASRMTSEVLSALAFCHARGICHRDLKLDNILLLRGSRNSPIRVADFGLASQVQEVMCKEEVKRAHAYAKRIKRDIKPSGAGKSLMPDSFQRKAVRLSSFKGTPEYMAPEVLAILNASVNKTGETAFYDFRCDVWSLGVVVHAVLTGREPYILEDVASYVENSTPLPKRNASFAKYGEHVERFVDKCLCANYEERPTSSELLKEPFLKEWELEKEVENDAKYLSERSDMIRSLHEFSDMSHIKRAALTAAARHLCSFEQEELRQRFEIIDTNKNGCISLQELCIAMQTSDDNAPRADNVPIDSQGLLRMGASPSIATSTCIEQDRIIRAFAAMDTDLSGEVDYTEFLAAVMNSKIEDRRDLAWAAFRSFDLDGNGSISKNELEKVLADADLQTLLEEVCSESQKIRSFTSCSEKFPGKEPSQKTEESALDFSSKLSVAFPASPSFRKLAEQSFTSRGVDEVFKLADTNNDGDISFEEFLDLLSLG